MFNIPCKFVYLGLSCTYLASCFDLNKVVLSGLAAAAYAALALARDH